ncbi:MAG: hypothetical protein WAO19_01095 [Candidatus Kryptoniota bacterium]
MPRPSVATLEDSYCDFFFDDNSNLKILAIKEVVIKNEFALVFVLIEITSVLCGKFNWVKLSSNKDFTFELEAITGYVIFTTAEILQPQITLPKS